MKARIVSVLLLALTLGFTPAPPTLKPIWWEWHFDPAMFGGMTTNQFATNVTFRVLSVTDCTIPTNAWPVLTNYPASAFIAYDGHWTNKVVADGSTRFYLLTVGVANGNSPFSDPFVWIPLQSPGIMGGVGP